MVALKNANVYSNQTNLALKGIIGIEAMATISSITNNPDDSENRTTIAKDYIERWQTLGIVNNTKPAHTTLSYGDSSSHGLLYNLYADRELGLNLVPQSVYDMQSSFYPTIEATYGVPLDTRHSYTKSRCPLIQMQNPQANRLGDWELFAAAVASNSTRDMFIKDLATWINETPTNRPMTDLYETSSGE